MMSIFLPHVVFLPKLITEMPRKEIQILIGLWKCLLKRLINTIYRRLFRRFLDRLCKERGIFTVVG